MKYLFTLLIIFGLTSCSTINLQIGVVGAGEAEAIYLRDIEANKQLMNDYGLKMIIIHDTISYQMGKIKIHR